MAIPMNRQKKVFLIVAVLFVIAVILFSVDIASRTTGPWEKGNLRTRIDEQYGEEDSKPKANTQEADTTEHE